MHYGLIITTGDPGTVATLAAEAGCLVVKAFGSTRNRPIGPEPT